MIVHYQKSCQFSNKQVILHITFGTFHTNLTKYYWCQKQSYRREYLIFFPKNDNFSRWILIVELRTKCPWLWKIITDARRASTACMYLYSWLNLQIWVENHLNSSPIILLKLRWSYPNQQRPFLFAEILCNPIRTLVIFYLTFSP